MENAAKALVIAGGILLALMTLSLIVYLSTATNRMAQAQDDKVAAEQLAYNKTRLYGTEMISVANKVIDYNKTLTPAESTKAINLKITDLDGFVSTKTTKTIFPDGTTSTVSVDDPTNSFMDSKIIIDYNTSNDVKNFFKQETKETTVTKKVGGHEEQTTTYTALSNFKRTIFQCMECKDTNEDGRIDLMIFKQRISYKAIDN